MNLSIPNAIRNLAPNSEFSIKDNDYSTIEWIVLEGNAPTKAEIDVEIKRMAAEVEAQAAAKVALLDRLGITAEEASLLFQ
jgi:hypothetical protein